MRKIDLASGVPLVFVVDRDRYFVGMVRLVAGSWLNCCAFVVRAMFIGDPVVCKSGAK